MLFAVSRLISANSKKPKKNLEKVQLEKELYLISLKKFAKP